MGIDMFYSVLNGENKQYFMALFQRENPFPLIHAKNIKKYNEKTYFLGIVGIDPFSKT